MLFSLDTYIECFRAKFVIKNKHSPKETRVTIILECMVNIGAIVSRIGRVCMMV